jgi:hypothetical protein
VDRILPTCRDFNGRARRRSVRLHHRGSRVRRLHDSGRSGGWFFIAFVPFIGGLWLLILTLLGGTPGENRFGPDPKAAA